MCVCYLLQSLHYLLFLTVLEGGSERSPDDSNQSLQRLCLGPHHVFGLEPVRS
jgi:hypothetical protein